MITVLHVVSALKEGGVENLLVNYYKHMNDKGIRFDFITHRPGGSTEEYFESQGSQIFHLSLRRSHPFRSAKEAYRIFKNQNYRIVHFHGAIETLPQLLMAWLTHIPVRIVHAHTCEKDKTWIHFVIRKLVGLFLCALSTDRFACSDEAGIHTYGNILKNKKYHKIANAIAVSRYVYQPEVRTRIRCELGLNKKTVIGHVGRFVPVKNHAFLLEILQKLIPIRSDIVLLLIGSGELETVVRQDVRKKWLEEYVRFMGNRSDIPDLLQAMDVFVLPSISEGLPVSGIEAQAAGLPCLFSDSITRETALSERAEFLSLSDGAAKWAQKIVKCGDLQRIAFIDAFPQEYNASLQAEKLIQFYQEAYLRSF